MKVPHFSAVLPLSQLMATARRLAEARAARRAETFTLAGMSALLLAAACLPGPRHPASPPPPRLAEHVCRPWQWAGE